ncbi:hypothetical protein CB1_001499007 [Camelus ferus]|nr:hypothetical protein CB1_001499007 [Camelus ferus]
MNVVWGHRNNDIRRSKQNQKLNDFKYNIHKDQYRSCDNVSAKSSDSDVSDVSAVSRTSSASRLSSTSFMSEQSERPRGRISRGAGEQQAPLCVEPVCPLACFAALLCAQHIDYVRLACSKGRQLRQ